MSTPIPAACRHGCKQLSALNMHWGGGAVGNYSRTPKGFSNHQGLGIAGNQLARKEHALALGLSNFQGPWTMSSNLKYQVLF